MICRTLNNFKIRSVNSQTCVFTQILYSLVTLVMAFNFSCPAFGDSEKLTGKNENTSSVQIPLPQPQRIAQLVNIDPIFRNYPSALPSLIAEVNHQTGIVLDPQPVLISSFETRDIFKYPFIYANFADRPEWNFSELEQQNLRAYLERGGFLFIDAGINAEFLRKDTNFGQHHSYGEWEVTPELRDAFKKIFPDKSFQSLNRSHEIFRSFYKGLPDPKELPATVRDYVVNEKWPDGTYSLMGLYVNNRIAVLASPIVSMGWGKNSFGEWITTINFRVRETAPGLSEKLKTAAYSGERFEAMREDARKDIIYCQKRALPAWVEEPDGNWRIFRYYQSREISDYAHIFYTRLGVNIFVYAFTN